MTVFVNKALFSSKTINLDAPLFITWFQCLISATICFTMSYLSKKFPDTINFPRGNPLDKEIFFKVIPVSIFFVTMISTNNLCLKYVSVAFYYVGRSLTTVFNVVLSFLLLGQKTSFRCIICCVIIIAGFWIGVDQESITGLFTIKSLEKIVIYLFFTSRFFLNIWNCFWSVRLIKFSSVFHLHQENITICKSGSMVTQLLQQCIFLCDVHSINYFYR